MKHSYKRLMAFILILFCFCTTGCVPAFPDREMPVPTSTVGETPVSASPVEETPASAVPVEEISLLIITPNYLSDYLSGWELRYDGGVIRADAPSGTGSDNVSAYIQPDGGEEILLTPFIGIGNVYLSGDWLYFQYTDIDSEDYKYFACRVNVREPGEFEDLGVFRLFATEEYFFYRKEEFGKEVFRRDVSFENETFVLNDTGSWHLLIPACDKLILFQSEFVQGGGNDFTVYGQDGEELYRVPLSTQMAYRVYASDGMFYWCDFTYLPDSPVRFNSLDLNTGRTETVDVALDVEGFPLGVKDVADGKAYIAVNVYSDELIDGMYTPDNTFLYALPLAGGEMEFVRSWFES